MKRIRSTTAEMYPVVDSCLESGLTLRAFAEAHGISAFKLTQPVSGGAGARSPWCIPGAQPTGDESGTERGTGLAPWSVRAAVWRGHAGVGGRAGASGGMTRFHSSTRIFLYQAPADMRKGFDGLSGRVRTGMERDPRSGDRFAFIHRRRTLMKLLAYDDGAMARYYQRLDEGTFEHPDRDTLIWLELPHLRSGVTLESVRYRQR